MYPFHSTWLLALTLQAVRKISKIPFKVLDAPELQDDFYLNLVDWSSQNVLSVGLGPCVYLWSACTSQVSSELCTWRVSRLPPTRPWSRNVMECIWTVICLFLYLIAHTFTDSQGFILTFQVTRLCDLSCDGDNVTSVSWSERVRTFSSSKKSKLCLSEIWAYLHIRSSVHGSTKMAVPFAYRGT